MTDLTKLSVSGVHAWAYGKDLHPSEVWEKAFNELVRRLEEAQGAPLIMPFAAVLRDKLRGSVWPDSDPVWATLETWADELCRFAHGVPPVQ